MLAKDIMIKEAITVGRDASVKEVLEKFIAQGISGLPVINDNGEPIGFISDGDIMKHIGYHEPMVIDFFTFVTSIYDEVSVEEKINTLAKLNVLKIATTNVITVHVDTEIDKVAKILGNKKIKKVPVLENGVVVGIISRGDVIRHVVKNYVT